MQQGINKIIFKNPSQDPKRSFYCNIVGGGCFVLRVPLEGIVARSGEESEQHPYPRITLWIYHPQSSSMIHSLS